MKILFLYLDAFSNVGGIETYNRCFMKAVSEISNEQGYDFTALSLNDDTSDDRYIKSSNFKSFRNCKWCFSLYSIKEGLFSDLIIIGHINLYPIGLVLKSIGKNIILLTHGIEVWDKPNLIKKKFLILSDSIFTVSQFTRNKIQSCVPEDTEKIKVIPNTIDPYFDMNVKEEELEYLRNKYSISKETKVILTISRMRLWDRQKGYLKVLEIIPKLKNRFRGLKYFLLGIADDDEINMLQSLIKKLDIGSDVILITDINDQEIPLYYKLSDLFVMPSKKEGFGIVYLESLACGTPVIAGNKDGSAEPLRNGELGFLVNPDDPVELSDTIANVLEKKTGDKQTDSKYLVSEVTKEFGYDKFKSRISNNIEQFKHIVQ